MNLKHGTDLPLVIEPKHCHIRQSGSDLAACPSLAHHDRTTLIQADDVKSILADIDAHGGN
jgi:hypothetical protein